VTETDAVLGTSAVVPSSAAVRLAQVLGSGPLFVVEAWCFASRLDLSRAA
jgi:hypothetical protein